MARKKTFSLVLPAFNEARHLEDSVARIRRELKKIKGLDFEIIIAEDGSTDGTAEIAGRLAKRFRDVKHLHRDARLGRGTAVANAFRIAPGEVVGFCDADLATAPKHFRELIAFTKSYDVVIGSRYLSESNAARELSRHFLSFWYNFLVRFFLGSRLSDHQCGFKAFRKPVALDLCKRARSAHWFWDTEILVLAQKLGYRVKEIPVAWEEKGRGGKTKVDLSKDVPTLFFGILALWWRLFTEGIER